MVNSNQYVAFKVVWDVKATEDNLNLATVENLKEGLIYWRKDIILGFNNGGSRDRTQLILGLDHDIDGQVIRATFTVDESIEAVAKKMNQ